MGRIYPGAMDWQLVTHEVHYSELVLVRMHSELVQVEEEEVAAAAVADAVVVAQHPNQVTLGELVTLHHLQHHVVRDEAA